MNNLTLYEKGTQIITEPFTKSSDFNVRLKFSKSANHPVTLLRSMEINGEYAGVTTVYCNGNVGEITISGVTNAVNFKVLTDGSTTEISHD